MAHLLEYLPAKPRSAATRIVLTTVVVGLSVLVMLGIYQRGGLLGFFILLPSIFIASVFFDRGSGIYAAVLSTAILYVVVTPDGTVLLPSEFILPLLLFLFVGLAFAVMSEALRTGLERAAAAEHAKDLLLQELGHRTKNNLAMVISVLTIQARMKSNAEARSALEKAITRIQAIASAHDYFRPLEAGGRVEMKHYLEQLCSHLGDALRDVRPIAVRVDSAEIFLRTEDAVHVGLIVNELVTNALKHAFPDDRAGAVEVTLRKDSALTLLVRDDGVGCSELTREGTGSRLTRLLAQQIKASIAREQCDVGCRVRVVFNVD